MRARLSPLLHHRIAHVYLRLRLRTRQSSPSKVRSLQNVNTSYRTLTEAVRKWAEHYKSSMSARLSPQEQRFFTKDRTSVQVRVMPYDFYKSDEFTFASAAATVEALVKDFVRLSSSGMHYWVVKFQTKELAADAVRVLDRSPIRGVPRAWLAAGIYSPVFRVTPDPVFRVTPDPEFRDTPDLLVRKMPEQTVQIVDTPGFVSRKMPEQTVRIVPRKRLAASISSDW